MLDPHQEKVLILDFGSQYTQLIARRVRELKVYCEIHPYIMTLDSIKEFAPQAIILSGGPRSVYDRDAPAVDPEVFSLGVPILGICYGIQLLNHLLGGEVAPAGAREYGHKTFTISNFDDLFYGLNPQEQVWMSHGDRVERLAPGFEVIGRSDSCPTGAIRDLSRRLYGVQFHPEVHHTPRGKEILSNFLFRICKLNPLWTMASFIETATENIRQQVGDGRVICALSGGVTLGHRNAGPPGHRRPPDLRSEQRPLRKRGRGSLPPSGAPHLNLVYVDATVDFLNELKEVVDPEEKRRRIGHEFIRIFAAEAKKIGGVNSWPRAPYPTSSKAFLQRPVGHHQDPPQRRGPAHHHALQLGAFARAFKDEVREVGKELGLPDSLVWRHPFPGPGLAIRILGEVTADKLDILREADAIVSEMMLASEFYRQVWQAFAVLLPIRTVGVMGDERTYEFVVALRIVDSIDAMTADGAACPMNFWPGSPTASSTKSNGSTGWCWIFRPSRRARLSGSESVVSSQ
jgi:GMP synthase (glutamine-hydrolysing)